MTVSGVVMAHEKRRGWAEDLSTQLDIPIVWDQVNDRHETGLRCLRAGLDTDATHWLIVQDDAIVCRDLLDGVAKATEFSGDRVIGLYVGNVRPNTGLVGKKVDAAQRLGRSWLALAGPLWGVGIVIPTGHLPALVQHYTASREDNYDRRIERWSQAAKVECWYTVPSLVEHRSGDENPSLVKNRTSLSRRARAFIGADASALDVDWSLTPLDTTNHALWRNLRTGRVQRVQGSQARRFEESGQWEPVVQESCGECGGPRYQPLAATA